MGKQSSRPRRGGRCDRVASLCALALHTVRAPVPSLRCGLQLVHRTAVGEVWEATRTVQAHSKQGRVPKV